MLLYYLALTIVLGVSVFKTIPGPLLQSRLPKSLQCHLPEAHGVALCLTDISGSITNPILLPEPSFCQPFKCLTLSLPETCGKLEFFSLVKRVSKCSHGSGAFSLPWRTADSHSYTARIKSCHLCTGWLLFLFTWFQWDLEQTKKKDEGKYWRCLWYFHRHSLHRRIEV